MTVAEHGTLLRHAFTAYNRRDADALALMLHEDVDWPDGSGGRLHGREAVKSYWTAQWTRTRTQDDPTGFEGLADGRIAVRLDQTVRALDGAMIFNAKRRYIFEMEGHLIRRLDFDQDGLSAL